MNTPKIEKTAFRTAEAAKYLGIGLTTLYKLLKQDPDFPQGIYYSSRCRVFLRQDLDRWLDTLKERQRLIS